MGREKDEGSSESSDSVERRRHDRHNTNDWGTLTYLGLSFPSKLVDVSAGGALIASNIAPPASAEVEIDFPELGRFLANVVHSAGSNTGVEFKKELAVDP